MLHLVSILLFLMLGLVALGTILVTVLDHAESIVRALRRQPLVPHVPAPIPPRIDAARIRMPSRPHPASALLPLRAAA